MLYTRGRDPMHDLWGIYRFPTSPVNRVYQEWSIVDYRSLSLFCQFIGASLVALRNSSFIYHLRTSSKSPCFKKQEYTWAQNIDCIYCYCGSEFFGHIRLVFKILRFFDFSDNILAAKALVVNQQNCPWGSVKMHQNMQLLHFQSY